MVSDQETALVKRLKRLFKQHAPSKWNDKHHKKCGAILHELGTLYKEESLVEEKDSMGRKIKAIQSAALLNCARIRISSTDCENELKCLCTNILIDAGAEKKDFDLVIYADSLKRKIDAWRSTVAISLRDLSPIPKTVNSEEKFKHESEKIEVMESLQNRITEHYKSYMKNVAQTVIDVLGETPCHYALVGMGSMARKEITPFSDFENMILLPDKVQHKTDEKTLEYFRWFAVIFQVILINLGETILPSVAISSLNDYSSPKAANKDWFYDSYTPRGISFDGMMPHACKSPLGRQQILKNKPWKTELIKPISEMVEYLSKKENLKNGYHLADILTNTCFVAGNSDFHEKFEKAVEKKIKEESLEVVKVIKQDMETFSTKYGIANTINKNSCNIKQFVYRSTTIFVVGIAKLHNIKVDSCFEIVRELQKRELMSDEFCRKLQYAIAIACEVRLRAYFEKGRQNDNIEGLFGEDEQASSMLAKAVGEQSCYDYFEIACSLQYDVITSLNMSRKYLFYHPVTMCIAISSLLNLYDLIVAAWKYVQNYPILCHQPVKTNIETESSNENEILGSWYCQMQAFNLELETQLSKMKFSTLPVSEKIYMSVSFGQYLHTKELYFEAVCCYRIALLLMNNDVESECPSGNATCLFWIGKCLHSQQQFEDALQNFQEGLNVYHKFPKQQIAELFEGDCNKEIAVCYMQLNQTDKAATSFEIALDKYKETSRNAIEEIQFCLLNLSICYRNLQLDKEADNRLDEFLEIVSANKPVLHSPQAHHEYARNMADCHDQIAQFHLQHFHPKIALEHLKQALFFYEDFSQETSIDFKIVELYRETGRAYQGLQNFKKACLYYKKAFLLYGKIIGKEKNDNMKADILHNLGYCLKETEEFNTANKYVIQSLLIYEELLALDKRSIFLYKNIGYCYLTLKCPNIAHMYFKVYVELLRKQEHWSEKDVQHVAFVWKQIGFYCNKRSTKDFSEANVCFHEALKSFSKLLKNPKRDYEIACLLIAIGDHHLQASAFAKAKECFSQAQKILESLPQLPKVRFRIAWMLKIIGYHYKNQKQYCKAKGYFEAASKILSTLPYVFTNQKEKFLLLKEIGFCHKNEGSWTEAVEYFQNSIKILETLPKNEQHTLQIAIILKNMGFCFKYQRNFSRAIDSFSIALKQLQLLPKNGKNDRDIAVILEHIAKSSEYIYWNDSDYTKPYYSLADHYTRALDAYQSLSDQDNFQSKISFLERKIQSLKISVANL